MLYTTAHFYKISQDYFSRIFFYFYVDSSDCNQQITFVLSELFLSLVMIEKFLNSNLQSRYNWRLVLDQFVQVITLKTSLKLVNHKCLEMSQLIGNFNVFIF